MENDDDNDSHKSSFYRHCYISVPEGIFGWDANFAVLPLSSIPVPNRISQHLPHCHTSVELKKTVGKEEMMQLRTELRRLEEVTWLSQVMLLGLKIKRIFEVMNQRVFPEKKVVGY